MEKYVLMTDSTCDLRQDQVEQLGIEIIPFPVMIEEKMYYHYPDYRELDVREFYQKLRNGIMPSTAQINIATFVETFGRKVQEGKEVVYISFSSALSGNIQSAKIAAKEVMEQNEGSKIYVVDSKAASMGQGLLVCMAAAKKKEGLTAEELVKYIEEIRDKVCHYGVADDLNHLKRGGRISSSAALIGTVMGIKPIITVDESGKLYSNQRIRGKKAALNLLTDKMAEKVVEPQEQTVFIAHADCEEDANFLADLVKKRFNPKKIEINYIGPIVGAHTGPGTVEIFFIGKEK